MAIHGNPCQSTAMQWINRDFKCHNGSWAGHAVSTALQIPCPMCSFHNGAEYVQASAPGAGEEGTQGSYGLRL